MDQDKFIKAYKEVRNGTNNYYFDRLVPHLLYSDGVKECMDAGCRWLLYTLGTELISPFNKQRETTSLCIVTVTVAGNAAKIVGQFNDEGTNAYTKDIPYTDLPEGEWMFYVSVVDEHKYLLYIPSEY